VAGMTPQGREAYLHDTPGRFDEVRRRIHYFNDSPHAGGDAKSMFFLRLFEDERGRTLAASHSARAFAGTGEPSAADTVVYRLERGRWVNITARVMPDELPGDWWFRFDGDGESVACGPYIQYMRHDGLGLANDFGHPSKHIEWHRGAFKVVPETP